MYSQLITDGHTEESILSKAGLSAHKLGRLTAAKQYFLKLDSLYTGNKVALGRLASIYEQENNSPKAIKFYNKLAKIDPYNSLYYRKLGNLFQKEGLYKDGLKHYTIAHDINPCTGKTGTLSRSRKF